MGAGLVDPSKAADLIYLLNRAFYSTWYETLDGDISLCRRKVTSDFKPRLPDLVKASALLQSADIAACDFRVCLSVAKAGDLIFADPPPTCTRGGDHDLHAYNSKRFNRADYLELVR